MPIIIEALYLVAPVARLKRRLIGGAATFEHLAPNTTFVSDGEVAGCGFMSLADANSFALKLGELGLRLSQPDADSDLVLVDMRRGVIGPSTWPLFEKVPAPGYPGFTLATLRLRDGESTDLKGFEGWDIESSINFQEQRGDLAHPDDLEFIGTTDGVDTYRHKLTGNTYYSGRSRSKKLRDQRGPTA